MTDDDLYAECEATVTAEIDLPRLCNFCCSPAYGDADACLPHLAALKEEQDR